MSTNGNGNGKQVLPGVRDSLLGLGYKFNTKEPLVFKMLHEGDQVLKVSFVEKPEGEFYVETLDGQRVDYAPEEAPGKLVEARLMVDGIMALNKMNQPAASSTAPATSEARPAEGNAKTVKSEGTQQGGEVSRPEPTKPASPSGNEVKPASGSTMEPGKNLPARSTGKSVARKNLSFGIDWQGLPKEAVIEMGGKPYITKAGLSYAALKLGVSTRVEPVRWSFEKHPDGQKISIFRGIATTSDGKEFVDYGMASAENTTKMIVNGGNLDHMASTRAFNRATRLATACGYCSVEELPEPPQDFIDAEYRTD